MKENTFWSVVAHTVLMTFAIICILPFVLLFISSVSDEVSITRNGYTFFPSALSAGAYEYLQLQSYQILHAYGVTVLVTVVGTTVGLLITSLLAYGLSRKNLPFRGFFAFLVFFTLLFNGGLVPTYWIYTQVFHVKNTLWALIVPGLLMNGFNVLLMRSFFVTAIPEDILDAARIDGASEFQIYWSIVMPMSTPILATIGLFMAIAYWNDWFNGLIYLTDPQYFSLQNLLNRILANVQFLQTSDLASRAAAGMNIPLTSVRMAMAVIAVVPILALYPFFQKYFARGITLGGVKG